MTTPTQAQIEAAGKAFTEVVAAANEYRLAKFNEAIEAALTAAAQVGEERDATIERCAQVAEEYGGHNVPLIAAAIRKLKETSP